MLECVEGVDVASRLGSITLPTLVLHGNRDVISPLAASERLLELIPHAGLRVADGAGHVPTVTRPEWVAAQIQDFFPQE